MVIFLIITSLALSGHAGLAFTLAIIFSLWKGLKAVLTSLALSSEPNVHMLSFLFSFVPTVFALIIWLFNCQEVLRNIGSALGIS